MLIARAGDFMWNIHTLIASSMDISGQSNNNSISRIVPKLADDADFVTACSQFYTKKSIA